MSLCRQNYHEDEESAINKHINLDIYAAYTYLSLAFHFDRDDVALKGCFTFFKNNSSEKRENAMKLMKYQNKRGGRVVLNEISKPVKDEWGTALDAMNSAVDLQRHINQSWIDIHKTAVKHTDTHLMQFVATRLTEQTEVLKQLADYVTSFKRVGPGHGEHAFDRELLSNDNCTCCNTLEDTNL
ncbi:soma ferritin-like [Antedon mediterranea]|uniref:soma ferritin-like n=1 Tax=Antedon mediterranea TaxID=105859 RepID=UPI003AF60027